jgi:hypothetical protein
MFTKTPIALAAALVLGNVSIALADGEFDANSANRYPQAPHTQTLQSRSVALTGAPRPLINNESYLERASKSWDGGSF